MLKYTITLFLSLAGFIAAFPQSKFRIGLSQDVIVPMGTFSKNSNTGNGVAVFVRYAITKKIICGINTAYLWFGNKNAMPNNYTLVIPASGTLEYLFLIREKWKLYTGFDAGYYAVASSNDPWKLNFRPGGAPFIGTTHALNNRIAVFLTLKYFNVLNNEHKLNASIAIGSGLTFRL